MEKIPHHSHDSIRDNFDKIQKLFPSVVHEVKDENGNIKKELDIDEFKKLFDNNFAENIIERYSLNWPGKRKSLIRANTPITDTLRPARDESVDFDTTKNLYIEWDNFAVLKTLQHAYMGKVKMIYIDPPYNTGKDFVYNDNFTEDIASYREKTGEIVDGVQMEKNTDTNGRFHSDWLSMMYERLIVARDLLTEDGVIFMSIDDNEVHNLRKLADEIFGEENFMYALTVVDSLNGNDNSSGMMETHEYCLIYAKNSEKFTIWVLPLEDEEFDEWDKDEFGYWKVGGWLKATGINAPREARPNLFFPIYIDEDTLEWSLEERAGIEKQYHLIPLTEGNEMRWYWSKQKFLDDSNEVIVKRSKTEGYSLYKKQRPALWDLPNKRWKTTFYNPKYATANSNAEMKKIFWKKLFDYTKSTKLIYDFISLGNVGPNDIVLDFFSGSATTAHTVMQLNAEDGGNRQFILVQIPEKIDEGSEAHKAGYKNICEIGKERIRRAATKIREDFATQIAERETPLDTGFRVYKLDSTNYQNNDILPQDMSQQSLDNFIDTFKSGRTPEDILTEILLREGQVLSGNIETKIVWNNTLYIIDGGIVACLDKTIDNDTIKTIVDVGPHSVILLDETFGGDDAMKINTEQLFKKSLGEEVLIKIF